MTKITVNNRPTAGKNNSGGCQALPGGLPAKETQDETNDADGAATEPTHRSAQGKDSQDQRSNGKTFTIAHRSGGQELVQERVQGTAQERGEAVQT